jgi:hypothetical protein
MLPGIHCLIIWWIIAKKRYSVEEANIENKKFQFWYMEAASFFAFISNGGMLQVITAD